ncbi:hypothetical protein NM208_g8384 [Fusarium decemcellulare]|uniref:Uncharacterized protein n=1 Tax=Fusarium decemcellulare TaxID=57161 RepID=A0ACC1S5H9_9HYPO|nr:hypothetical protein NM208_g8384 [Fusarium decemcellulare]
MDTQPSLPRPSVTDSRSRQPQKEEDSLGVSLPQRQVYTSKYRASWPTLRPLPLEAGHRPLPTPMEECRCEIEIGAKKVLEKYELMDDGDETEVSVCWRQVPMRSHTAVPTLYIVTPWKEDAKQVWPQAVQDLVNMVEDTFQGHGHQYMTCSVEMLAPERVKRKYLGVTHEPGLLSAWPNLQASVREILNSFEATRARWNSIALFRLGFLKDPACNPMTVFIAVDYDSDETKWDEVIDRIKHALEEAGWGSLEVHIEHNSWDIGLFD